MQMTFRWTEITVALIEATVLIDLMHVLLQHLSLDNICLRESSNPELPLQLNKCKCYEVSPQKVLQSSTYGHRLCNGLVIT